MDLYTTCAKNTLTIEASIKGRIIALNSGHPLNGRPKTFEAGTANNAANGPFKTTPTINAGIFPNFS